MLAADTCLTTISAEGEARSRSYERKIKTFPFRLSKIDGKVAIASSGDSGLAMLDDMIMAQAAKLFSSQSFSGYLAPAMNDARSLAKRRDIIKKGEYEAIFVIFHGNIAMPYQVESTGFINRFDADFDDTAPGPKYTAIGSDAAVALGAMYADASAIEAVRAASYHGAHTGGEITAISVVDGKIKESVY